MIRKDAVEFYKKLNELKTGEYNKFLLYSIIKTKSELVKLYDEVIVREKEIIQFEPMREFQNKKAKILATYCERDSENKAIVVDNNVKIKEEFITVVDSELRTLAESYTKDFETHDTIISDYNKFMLENVDVNIIKTSFKNLPETTTPEIFELLVKFVKETDSEVESLQGI